MNVDSMKRRYGQGSNGWKVEPPPILVKIYRPVMGRRGSRVQTPLPLILKVIFLIDPGFFVGVGVGAWPLG